MVCCAKAHIHKEYNARSRVIKGHISRKVSYFSVVEYIGTHSLLLLYYFVIKYLYLFTFIFFFYCTFTNTEGTYSIKNYKHSSEVCNHRILYLKENIVWKRNFIMLYIEECCLLGCGMWSSHKIYMAPHPRRWHSHSHHCGNLKSCMLYIVHFVDSMSDTLVLFQKICDVNIIRNEPNQFELTYSARK
jgi:hypothetical protein